MSEAEVKIRAPCPKCGGSRKALVRAQHIEKWGDEDVNGSIVSQILECCGCEFVFFRTTEDCSEWGNPEYDSSTGETTWDPETEVTIWPKPNSKKPPAWLAIIGHHDQILGRLLAEMYTALDSQLPVLAAIGARTAFDRSSELLGIATSLPFAGKLEELLTAGKIGVEEKNILEVLIDAGSAAAHRGWSPEPEELQTMQNVIENFLYRSFVLGDQIKRLRAAVPPRR